MNSKVTKYKVEFYISEHQDCPGIRYYMEYLLACYYYLLCDGNICYSHHFSGCNNLHNECR